METKPTQWTCPVCEKAYKAQGRGAHLRLAHQLKIREITDEELKLALEKNLSLKDPELMSKLKLNSSEHKSDISSDTSGTIENTNVSEENISSNSENLSQDEEEKLECYTCKKYFPKSEMRYIPGVYHGWGRDYRPEWKRSLYCQNCFGK